ncbi:tetratricopeptide repeat protein [Nocardia rhizosphaerihabitans]|nr:tetratricopeptide repeat protein [Nocardia rhizosphaerihabitans]
MHNLGFLLWERGELTDAEHWYRKAADTGHPAP